MSEPTVGRLPGALAVRRRVQSLVQRGLRRSTATGRNDDSNIAPDQPPASGNLASSSGIEELQEASYHGLLYLAEQQQQPYARASHPPRLLHLQLDSQVPLLDWAECLQSNLRLQSLHATVHPSFAGLLPAEMLLFCDALSSRPNFTRLMIQGDRGDAILQHQQRALHAACALPLQGLSLALLQARRLRILDLRSLALTGTTSDFVTMGSSLQHHAGLEEVALAQCCCHVVVGSAVQVLQLESNGATIESSATSATHNNSQADDYTLDPVVRALSTIPRLQRVTLDATSSVTTYDHHHQRQQQREHTLGSVYAETLGSLCQSTTLTSLSLTGFTLTPNHLHSMAQGLAASSTVTELWMGTCHITSNHHHRNMRNGDAALARIIRRNASIAYLDVTLAPLAHLVQTAHALANNSTLQHFLVHGWDVTTKCQEAFVEVLSTSNCVLETLEFMDGTSIHQGELAFYTTLNRLLNRQRLLSNVHDKNLWVQALITQIDHLSALFYLLSNNPMLCS